MRAIRNNIKQNARFLPIIKKKISETIGRRETIDEQHANTAIYTCMRKRKKRMKIVSAKREKDINNDGSVSITGTKCH